MVFKCWTSVYACWCSLRKLVPCVKLVVLPLGCSWSFLKIMHLHPGLFGKLPMPACYMIGCGQGFQLEQPLIMNYVQQSVSTTTCYHERNQSWVQNQTQMGHNMWVVSHLMPCSSALQCKPLYFMSHMCFKVKTCIAQHGNITELSHVEVLSKISWLLQVNKAMIAHCM